MTGRQVLVKLVKIYRLKGATAVAMSLRQTTLGVIAANKPLCTDGDARVQTNSLRAKGSVENRSMSALLVRASRKLYIA